MDASEHSTLRLATDVSMSRLSRKTEPADGVADDLRRQRLLKTRDILSDNSGRRTISSSRMVNVSPKEARERGWRGSRRPAWLTIEEASKLPGHLLINILLGRPLVSKR